MKQVKSFFEITTNICKKTGDLRELPGFKKYNSMFMILRHLSCRKEFIKHVEMAQMVGRKLSDEQLYMYLYRVIPKYNGFLKYNIQTKKKKKEEA